MTTHGLVLAGMQSSSGKTAMTCLLLAVWRRQSLPVQAFKAGPDYLDPAYHAHYCNHPSINLDAWLSGRDELERLVGHYGAGKVGLLEGVMGLFDGSSPVTAEGSTLELAQWLNWPVVLVVPAAKAGRSLRAALRGFMLEAGAGRIQGLLLNQVSGEAHKHYLERSLSDLGIPILGALPSLPELQWPERHLGLCSVSETQLPSRDTLADLAERYLDLTRLQSLGWGNPSQRTHSHVTSLPSTSRRIGVARDAAFHFYYHENLRWLERQGAELIEFSPLADSRLPDGLDGLVLGGGFPESFAELLSQNQSLLQQLHTVIDAGLPCYAECGGLMLLAESLRLLDGQEFPMAGVIPGQVRMTRRLQHFGYTEVIGDEGTVLYRGHEFHHSCWDQESECANAWQVRKKNRNESRTEGFRTRNLHASYVHLYFPAAEPLFQNLFFSESST